jgi:hypothetical protein
MQKLHHPAAPRQDRQKAGSEPGFREWGGGGVRPGWGTLQEGRPGAGTAPEKGLRRSALLTTSSGRSRRVAVSEASVLAPPPALKALLLHLSTSVSTVTGDQPFKPWPFDGSRNFLDLALPWRARAAHLRSWPVCSPVLASLLLSASSGPSPRPHPAQLAAPNHQ